MKLLLTSGGVTNPSIAKALNELVGKKPEETNLAFIPTAANAEAGDKGWLIDDLACLKALGYRQIDIVDISALGRSAWQPRLEQADILFFEGGNTYHLMEWINRSGLAEMLPELLKTRVYVGLSAGSMVTGKDLALKASQIIYEEDFDRTEDMPALGLVDFYFLPHLNSPYFKKVTGEHVRQWASGIKEAVYALDDQSALKIVDGKIEIISEGKYSVFNR